MNYHQMVGSACRTDNILLVLKTKFPSSGLFRKRLDPLLWILFITFGFSILFSIDCRYWEVLFLLVFLMLLLILFVRKGGNSFLLRYSIRLWVELLSSLNSLTLISVNLIENSLIDVHLVYVRF